MKLLAARPTHSVRLLAILLLAVLQFSCKPQSDEHIALRVGHTLDQQHSVHQALEFMDQRLAYYSNGSMSLKLYPGSQLGSEREMIELLQIGTLAMTSIPASPLEGFVPRMKVFSLPYIFRDSEHYWRVLGGEVGRTLLEGLSEYKLHGMGYFDAGSRSFYTTQRPIYTPDDLKGLKIRVLNSATAVEMIRMLGGAATPVSWGELYTALQQGVVDGAENNPPSYYLSHQYEAARYFSLDEHTSVPDIVLCSQRVWKNLNAQQQRWLSLALQDATQYQRKLWQKSTETSLKLLKQDGVEIIYPDKAAFAERVEPMHERLNGTPLGALLKRIEAV